MHCPSLRRCIYNQVREGVLIELEILSRVGLDLFTVLDSVIQLILRIGRVLRFGVGRVCVLWVSEKRDAHLYAEGILVHLV